MKKLLFVSVLLLVMWVFWANTAVEVNEWTIESPSIPTELNGLRIAQVSDLHNAEFGPENEKLLTLLAGAEPDIIVITGDLIDSRNTNLQIALVFAEKAVEIAPCYYVTGNHESRVLPWTDLRSGLMEAGVTVLENEKQVLQHKGAEFTLIGMSDPTFCPTFERTLMDLTAGEQGYTILLSHRPELFEGYCASGVDLVFSGHAHGGQVRLPLIGGLIAPHQGFFPEYDGGLYRHGDTAMLVSRGLGNSICPLRFNNRPEIVLAILRSVA